MSRGGIAALLFVVLAGCGLSTVGTEEGALDGSTPDGMAQDDGASDGTIGRDSPEQDQASEAAEASTGPDALGSPEAGCDSAPQCAPRPEGGACGAPGQQCCPTDVCNAPACCDPGSGRCVPNGNVCGGGCCAQGTCVSQGTSCGPGQVCIGTGCTACGGAGQQCCATDVCNAPACCDPGSGQCVPNGNVCGGGCCAQGTCVGQGTSCGPGQVCTGLGCTPCGGRNQTCCEFSACQPMCNCSGINFCEGNCP